MRWIQVTIRINGKVKTTLTGSALHHSATLKRLPSGRFHLTVTARAAGHRSATITRTYTTCATPKKKPPTKPTTPTTPTPTSAIQPGSYSGSDYTLYVSADGTQVQDVSLESGFVDRVTCTPGTTFSDTSFSIPNIAIAADGSFTGTATQTGTENGVPATFTYTISGRFTGTSMSGSVREDVSYNDGVAHACTTGTAPVSMTRDAQGSQVLSAPPAGSYSGSDYTFYVSADGTQVQDVSLESGFVDRVTCTPGTTFSDTSLSIPNIALAPDGSFSGTATQTGTENGALATFTYTISGHFHGLDSSGRERVAGQIREDVSYNDGTAHTCTTGTMPISMTRDAQGSQVLSAPPAGSYTGSDYTFRVSGNGSNIQNVTLEAGFVDRVGCAPGTTLNDTSFDIPNIAIAADGSFTGSTTETGTENKVPAVFTYTFSGHFHGLDSSGRERAAGQIREDVTYNDGTAHTCTTGTMPVSMIWSSS